VTHDEAEFLISQHFDGTLSPSESDRLRAAMEGDAGIRAMFAEHGLLDAALRSSRSVPDFDAAAFTASVAEQIDADDASRFRMPWLRRIAPVAAAAGLLVAAGVAWFAFRPESDAPVDTMSARVVGPSVFRGGEGFASVSVGTPAVVSPQVIAQLFVAQQPRRTVVIQPAQPADFDWD
jgi:negative regulator of sigma E activity